MEGSRYSKKRITGGENHPALIKISKIDKEDEKQAGMSLKKQVTSSSLTTLRLGRRSAENAKFVSTKVI